MLICVKCFTPMKRIEMGVFVGLNPTQVRSADYFECQDCGHGVLTHAGTPHKESISRKLYNREIGRNKTLFRIDTKEYLRVEATNAD